MEEEIVFNLWEPYVALAGKGVTAAVLLTKALLTLRRSIRGASPQAAAVASQLPIALDRARFSAYKIHQQCAAVVQEQLCPIAQTKEQLHGRALTKERKLKLWGELLRLAVFLLLVGPYIKAVEAAVAAVRSAACVMLHHRHAPRSSSSPLISVVKSFVPGLGRGTGDAAAGGGMGSMSAMLEAFLSSMSSAVATTPLLEEIAEESDEIIAHHLQRVVIPAVFHAAAASVERVFATGEGDEWHVTRPVAFAQFQSAFGAVQREFQVELDVAGLLRGIRIVPAPANPGSSKTSDVDHDCRSSNGSCHGGDLRGEGGQEPPPRGELGSPSMPPVLIGAAAFPRHDQRVLVRRELQSCMSQLLASEAFETMVLDSACHISELSMREIERHHVQCKSFDSSTKCALVLHATLGIVVAAQESFERAPETTKLMKNFCAELVRLHVPE